MKKHVQYREKKSARLITAPEKRDGGAHKIQAKGEGKTTKDFEKPDDWGLDNR